MTKETRGLAVTRVDAQCPLELGRRLLPPLRLEVRPTSRQQPLGLRLPLCRPNRNRLRDRKAVVRQLLARLQYPRIVRGTEAHPGSPVLARLLDLACLLVQERQVRMRGTQVRVELKGSLVCLLGFPRPAHALQHDTHVVERLGVGRVHCHRHAKGGQRPVGLPHLLKLPSLRPVGRSLLPHELTGYHLCTHQASGQQHDASGKDRWGDSTRKITHCGPYEGRLGKRTMLHSAGIAHGGLSAVL